MRPESFGTTEQINPKWVKPSMSITQAANQAHARGFYLKASWNSVTGIRIVAVPLAQEGKR